VGQQHQAVRARLRGLPNTELADFAVRRLGAVRDVNLFEFGYDWRKHNRLAGRQLKAATDEWLAAWRDDGHPDARLVSLAHSMGGLVARHFLEVEDGWRDTRALISLGTPYRGASKALGALANGVPKLRRFVDLRPVLQSFPSMYQLLPIYPCYDRGDGRLVRLNEAGEVPGLDPGRVLDADEFHHEIERKVAEHQQLEDYREHGYTVYPVIGTEQYTAQSACLRGDEVVVVESYEGQDFLGDGTVPRVSASTIEHEEARATYSATKHASLQNASHVHTQIRSVLSRPDLARFRDGRPPVALRLGLEDVYDAGEPVEIRVTPTDARVEVVVDIEPLDEGVDPPVMPAMPLGRGEGATWVARVDGLSPGTYRVTAAGGDLAETASDLPLVV
jgi:hypothetical protein